MLKYMVTDAFCLANIQDRKLTSEKKETAVAMELKRIRTLVFLHFTQSRTWLENYFSLFVFQLRLYLVQNVKSSSLQT